MTAPRAPDSTPSPRLRAADTPGALASGTQCTGSRLSPQPPTTTAPSTTPALAGDSTSRSAAHHHSAPPARATAPRAGTRMRPQKP
ncbi:hypothetical protein [Streptomyces sp. NPDC086023]|uniref:hypothetical protein n=1 Tax=Streptomyces sp. NPDC086023 TaxID=3365746 RepID=UPI0037CD1088